MTSAAQMPLRATNVAARTLVGSRQHAENQLNQLNRELPAAVGVTAGGSASSGAERTDNHDEQDADGGGDPDDGNGAPAHFPASKNQGTRQRGFQC